MEQTFESILETLPSSRIPEDSLNGLGPRRGVCTFIVRAEREQTTAIGKVEPFSHVQVCIQQSSYPTGPAATASALDLCLSAD
jgi:hypothetical protein